MADSERDLTARRVSNIAVTRKHLRRGQGATSDRRKSRIQPTDNKLQQLKEAKEAKRGTLDARHQHLVSSIATRLGLEDAEVEEFILEGDQVTFVTILSLLIIID